MISTISPLMNTLAISQKMYVLGLKRKYSTFSRKGTTWSISKAAAKLAEKLAAKELKNEKKLVTKLAAEELKKGKKLEKQKLSAMAKESAKLARLAS